MKMRKGEKDEVREARVIRVGEDNAREDMSPHKDKGGRTRG